ncbi:MAG: B12-binding domain-containing radical SAM protein [Thermodesulfobacteriota bacterium]|nr:MAG: B12-binding domain-containing radical SAM protein [Thermodesulfobacteriota bacterium]
MNSESFTIILINPWIYDFAAYDFWAKPLGFLYLAALLRKNGFSLHYIDCLSTDYYSSPTISWPRQESGKGKFLKTKVEKPEPLKGVPRNYCRYGIPSELFDQKLLELPEPDVILVTSGMTYWYQGVGEVILRAKKIFPKIPIILGGTYVTICTAHAKKKSGADFVIPAHGELEILKLVSALAGKEITFNSTPELLDSLPYPAFDLYTNLPYVCITTSRGCPYHCAYCASNLLAPNYTFRDPIAVGDEIEFWWKHHGVTNFAFYDDALLFNSEKRLIPFMKEIIRRSIPANFHTPNGMHLRGMTEDMARLMFLSGFKTIRFGLETADEKLMKKTGGKTTRAEFIQAVKYLKKAGFPKEEIGVYLLAGLPGQRAEEVEESITFVRDCGARPYLAEYSPIPGTILWEEAIKASRFDLVSEPLFHNNSLFPCEWEGFTRKDLQRLKLLARS